jgi:hypothetical protein
MKIIPSYYKQDADSPLNLKISFETIFSYLENIASNKNHYFNPIACKLLEKYNNYPILREGFDDFSYLEKYSIEIDDLLAIIFPDLLQSSEIKAVTVPFDFTTFKLTDRFKSILEDAGTNFHLKLHHINDYNLFMISCTFILAYYYNFDIDFKRPFHFSIPNKKTGITKYYRTRFNRDFFKIKRLNNAVKITEEDLKILIDNYNNIEIWKKYFPPKSYEFSGFIILNLFDVTPDYLLSSLKENLLKKDEDSKEIEKSISNLFDSTNIKFGVSIYDLTNKNLVSKFHKYNNSYIIKPNFSNNNFFCDNILSKVFEKNEMVAISDIEKYGKIHNYNGLYTTLKKQKINSILLIPMKLKNKMLGIMELVSKNKYELNSINAAKLKDIIPVFNIAIIRYLDEFENKLESLIQNNYTSLHPTLKWKFYKVVSEFISKKEKNRNYKKPLKDIVFKNVIPLYGQSDIKGSSTARNLAIQKDLITQLNLASTVFKIATKKYNLPIYNDLLFRINNYLIRIKKTLNSNDEMELTDFFNEEIYPIFKHLKPLEKELNDSINNYINEIDKKHHIVYNERKKFEESVDSLNTELAKFIDYRQEDAQKMFPHYFERFKTDGISYNLYIGQSLVNDHTYNKIYLENLRLWQLQLTCEMELIARNLKGNLSHKLDVASLILVHSKPLAIKFRMDEKRFDIDGAYNIRYEIIKKRIDKVHIKNTTERLTQPGKIAIVYSQNKDAQEYLEYIHYLQAKNYLLPTIENVDLEDLQGISGLRAFRVLINFKYDITEISKLLIETKN